MHKCLLLSLSATLLVSAAVHAQENPFLPLQILAETTSPTTGNRYQLTSMTTWVDAYDFAEAQGGWLWVVNDPAEMNYVVDAFLPAVSQYQASFVSPPGFGTAGRIDIYIGLTDNEEYGATEGDWQWVNGDSVLFTNWSGGEPNNVGTGGEDWGEIWNLKGNRTWNDERDTESGLDGNPASTPARLPGGGNVSVIELPPIPPPLNLEIDPSTGFAQVVSVTDVLLEFRSYSLTGPGGVLDGSAWESSNLSSRGVDAVDPGSPGQKWESVSSASDQLYEAFLFGGSTIQPFETLLLGQVMQPRAEGDPEPELAFEFASKNANPDISASVLTFNVPIAFVPFDLPSFLSADFDGDGDVDALDLAAWETGFGIATEATKMDGDASGDGAVSGTDFLAWQRQHGSGTTAAAATIPEPSALGIALVTLAAAGAALPRRRIKQIRTRR